MDKKRLVEFLQKKGQVVAVTGDGTNDAPALNAAHVGLSMGDGTSVAKEASDITIVDNSFSSISLAVMWGRSLYKNIQRFILFQLIVNVVACLTVLIGAFIGTENPITVTQMLWVNLIMDTFAAMALASLPPSKSVMNEKPRKRTDFIINRSMGVNIVVTGLLFTSLLIFLLLVFKQLKVDSIVDVFYPVLDGAGISEYELSLFFTIFVMLQFWNMFNAMAFGTKQSIFKQKNSKGFITIALLIIIGQILIVTFGGQMFNVTPLKIIDWIIIILSTSFVLWIKEIIKQILKS
jgi:Ca2+-transporting ATPase